MTYIQVQKSFSKYIKFVSIWRVFFFCYSILWLLHVTCFWWHVKSLAILVYCKLSMYNFLLYIIIILLKYWCYKKTAQILGFSRNNTEQYRNKYRNVKLLLSMVLNIYSYNYLAFWYFQKLYSNTFSNVVHGA